MSTGFEGSVDQIVAGSSLEATADFFVPADLDTTSASISYSLMDAEGAVYVSGPADTVVRTDVGSAYDRVRVTAEFTVPSNVPAVTRGGKFKLLWALQAAGFFSSASELITIIPTIRGDIGVEDAVEIQGQNVTLRAVLPDPDDAQIDIYQANTLRYHSVPFSNVGSSYSGYDFAHDVTPEAFGIVGALSPYTVVWSQGSDKEIGRLFYVTPSIVSALKELNSFLQRLKREVRLEELTFSSTDLLNIMKAAGDKFNGMGLYTSFTFTDAQGAILYWWLMCAQVVALRTRFLEEAEASFNFSGQAVQLEVDITSYIDQLASNLENQIETGLIPFKRQLHKRGILSGPGNAVHYVARTRGASGITTSPVAGAGTGNAGVAAGKGVIAVRR